MPMFARSLGSFSIIMPFLLILFICLSLFSSSTVQACSCAEKRSVSDEFNSSDVVFSGTVINVERNGGWFSPRGKSVIFEVSQIWKGTEQKKITITTGFGGGDCGIGLEEGKEYLVYAIHSTSYDGDLATGICDRTTELSAAAEDLLILGKGDEPTIESRPDVIFESRSLWVSILFGAGILIYLIWWKRRGVRD